MQSFYFVSFCKQILIFAQVIRGIPLGVGQIYACGDLGPSLLILGAVVLYSPLLAVHAVLGSAVGTLTGQFQRSWWEEWEK